MDKPHSGFDKSMSRQCKRTDPVSLLDAISFYRHHNSQLCSTGTIQQRLMLSRKVKGCRILGSVTKWVWTTGADISLFFVLLLQWLPGCQS